MRLVGRAVITAVLLLIVQSLVSAQSTTTSLHGTVYDPKGAVVSGAGLSLTNPATGFSRTTKSDDHGVYQFLELPPATYQLLVNASGFAAVKETGIELLVNTPGTVNVTMQVSGGTVTLEVTSSAPLVNTDDASMGHAFSSDQISNLPFEGRDPTGILSLQPGVVFTGNSSRIASASDSRSGSVNGARSDQTNVTLDGVDNNDQLLGTAFQGAVRVPLDSLEEFKVTTSNSDAGAGRSSGGQVSLVTKSGTNNVHGSVYEYHRPTFTTGNDWFNKASQVQAGQPNTPPFLLRNTFGANVGGPIIKDRLFFFAAYEGQRKREDLQATRVIPSSNLRNGLISYPCTQDPTCPASGVETLTAAQIASMDPNCSGLGTCPLGPGPNPLLANISGANPSALFNQYPTPNTDTVGDGLDFRGFTFSSPVPSKQDAYVAKLDYNLSANGNHRVFVRGVLNNDNEAERSLPLSPYGDGTISQDGGSQFPGQPPGQTLHVNSKSLTAGYAATFSSSLINNFRFGYTRQGLDQSGLQTQHFIFFRGMDNLAGQTFTINTDVPVKNWADDLTKVKGHHTLQFGGNLRQVDNERASNAQSFFGAITNVYWLSTSAIANKGISLDPAAFGFPAVDSFFGASYDFAMAALAGLVTQVGSNYQLNKDLSQVKEGSLVFRHFRAHEVEFYGQDQWRARPNLTVTYGLRYTLLQPPYETSGTQVAPTISLNDWFRQRGQSMLKGQVYDPVIGFSLSGQANGKQPYWAWDHKDFAPRIAFAYSPSSDSGWGKRLLGGAGKTSIRAGYGLYFDHFGEGITNTFDRNGSFGLTTAITNAAGVQTVDGSARYSGLNTIPTISQSPTGSCAKNCPVVEPPPTGPFPVTPPLGVANGGFAIYYGLDDKLKTPYSHVIDFSITRELPHSFVFEASYVGRFAHRLLQEEDLAEPTNIFDSKSGTSYFQAAQALAKQYYAGVPIQSVQPIPYWENMFPGAAGPSSTNLGGSTVGFGTPCLGTAPANVSATQAMYDLFCENAGNETTALEQADVPGVVAGWPAANCYPSCATMNGKVTPYAYYTPQFSSLFAWRSTGNSAYNSGQFSLRHRAKGLEFDLNYTYSKSFDLGSDAERVSLFEGVGFGSSQVINSWAPNQNRAVSDFDAAHQINANWVYEIPVGHGKRFAPGMGRFANAVLGGWTVSGLWRWSSGYPFTQFSPAWSTNFDLQSPLVPLSSRRPETGSFIVAQASGGTGPNVFKDPGITDPSNPNAAINMVRPAYPGEGGARNWLRGPGTFNLDAGLAKGWQITERQSVRFTWEVFNVTNTPRFDVGTMQINGNTFLSSSTSFGNFGSTLSNPRVMEFALRYTF
jgi:Carboxypeptidase regulatory-like domain